LHDILKIYFVKFIIDNIIVFFVLVVVFIASCSVNSAEKNNDQTKKQVLQNGKPEITFDTLFYDFGNMIEGEKVAVTFRFRNTGMSELLILDAYSTCGCTVPDYSKEPVLPGVEGKIEVVFDSSNRSGLQNKTVTLKTNTLIGETTLWIKANVKSK
jgi:hypothetical protein